MATPQHGIFAVGTRSHHHLQFDLVDGAPVPELLAAIRAVREAATTVAGVNVVVGFGAVLWRRVAPDAVPPGLGPFAERSSVDGSVTMPADQHDLWLWLHAGGPDAVFDLARVAAAALVGLAEVVREQPCFTYQASRDLSGFEDGTENPPLDEAAAVATVPAGQPAEGASVVLLQRWVHDLDGFGALDPPDQDQVIGRSKVTSEELPESERSPRAHISRVVIEGDDGEELEVFRRSTAFGGVLEHGLMFLAFSSDVARLDRMLDRMLGIGDGVVDALTDHTASTGGAWYLAPPVEAFNPTAFKPTTRTGTP